MEFILTHTTHYKYNDLVSHGINMATLKPRKVLGQELLNYTIKIFPEPSDITERVDFFGNYVTYFSLQHPHKSLKVTTKSHIVRDFEPFYQDYFSNACQQITIAQAREALNQLHPEILEAKQYILDSVFIKRISNEIKSYAEVSFRPNRSLFEAAKELMHRIYTDFDFVSGFTTTTTPLEVVMKNKKGVCQDFAQIAIACVRSMGLPARYVSGYIETIPPEGQEKLIGADASHAWFSVFIPHFGWVDFDPTNNQIPLNQHIVVGWGRDYYDVPPLKGVVYGSGSSKLKVAVDISRRNHL